jgi:hypothetical protein
MRVKEARRNLTRDAGVLDDEIRSGAPGGIRTPDPLLRRQILYPAELRAQFCEFNPFAFCSRTRGPVGGALISK